MPTITKEPKFLKGNLGRPQKISKEIIAKVCEQLQTGCYLETAAAVSGVSKSLLFEWLKKGNKQKQGIYRQFLDAVRVAQNQAEQRDLLNISKVSSGQNLVFAKDEQGRLILDSKGDPIIAQQYRAPNWQASAWRLERKFPKKWGRLDRLETTGKDGSPLGPQVVVTMPDNGRSAPAKKIEEEQENEFDESGDFRED